MERYKAMVKTLPTYDKVFFVHYRCDNFNEGNRIYSLNIFCNDIAVEYAGNEVVNIKEYSEKVHELLSKGLTLVHWNQSHPAYGPDHVNQRY
ncbi:MAG: hypothetical protein Q4F57_06900, partial [Weeksellaceae bacterium]|nr:hypothetical protein [Weeksellaceae bacterium]